MLYSQPDCYTLKNKKIIIITAPSGSGKTTLVKRLLQACPLLSFSISASTRQPRDGEVNGRDYYFFAVNEFKQLIDENAFAEWEMVYTDKYYGTLKSELERIWGSEHYPLVDIDVQGALSIRHAYPETSLAIFIEAPSLDELRKRLLARGTETPATLEERVDKARYELTFADRFDRIIINDDLETAALELQKTVEQFLTSN